jgi:hypothetical protein
MYFTDNAASKQMSLLEDLAEEIKGKGTVAFVDCRYVGLYCTAY